MRTVSVYRGFFLGLCGAALFCFYTTSSSVGFNNIFVDASYWFGVFLLFAAGLTLLFFSGTRSVRVGIGEGMLLVLFLTAASLGVIGMGGSYVLEQWGQEFSWMNLASGLGIGVGLPLALFVVWPVKKQSPENQILD